MARRQRPLGLLGPELKALAAPRALMVSPAHIVRQGPVHGACGAALGFPAGNTAGGRLLTSPEASQDPPPSMQRSEGHFTQGFRSRGVSQFRMLKQGGGEALRNPRQDLEGLPL